MTLAERLRAIAGGRTARGDFATALIGHGAEKVCGALAALILISILSPSEYGVYLGAMAVFAVAAKVADLGLDTTTARAVARGRRQGGADEVGLLSAVLVAKLALACGAFVLLLLLAPVIALALDRAWMTPYVQLAGVGLFGKQLTGLYRAWFSGRMQFGRNAVFLTLGPFLLFIALGIAARQELISVPVCIGLAAGAPLLAVTLVTVTEGRPLLRRPWQHLGRLREVFTFSRWIYLTDVMSTLRTRLGSLLLLRLSTSEAAGIYGAADGLASSVSILGNTMLTVFVPRAAALHGRDEFRAFLRKSYLGLGLVLLLIPLAPLCARLGRPLVVAFVPEYVDSLPVFAVLLASMLFTIAAMPSSTVLYAIGKPQVETAIEVVSLLLTVVLMVTLVPRAAGSAADSGAAGAMGAGFAMLGQRVVSSGLVALWVFVHVYRGDAVPVGAPPVAPAVAADPG